MWVLASLGEKTKIIFVALRTKKKTKSACVSGDWGAAFLWCRLNILSWNTGIHAALSDEKAVLSCSLWGGGDCLSFLDAMLASLQGSEDRLSH